MFLSEEMDSDLLRLWGLVAELSDQLNNNRAVAAALQAQAGQVKVRISLVIRDGALSVLFRVKRSTLGQDSSCDDLTLICQKVRILDKCCVMCR